MSPGHWILQVQGSPGQAWDSAFLIRGSWSGADLWTTSGAAKMYRLIHPRDTNQDIDQPPQDPAVYFSVHMYWVFLLSWVPY